jgi:hypothetical protein
MVLSVPVRMSIVCLAFLLLLHFWRASFEKHSNQIDPASVLQRVHFDASHCGAGVSGFNLLSLPAGWDREGRTVPGSSLKISSETSSTLASANSVKS